MTIEGEIKAWIAGWYGRRLPASPVLVGEMDRRAEEGRQLRALRQLDHRLLRDVGLGDPEVEAGCRGMRAP